MKIIINLLLVLVIGALIYFVADGIYEPIQFKAEKDRRVDAVVDQLKKVRTAQLAFRGITGKFAHDFDTLKEVLHNDSFEIIRVFGNPDDDEDGEEVIYETILVSAKDSINKLGLDLDSIKLIPFGGGKAFDVKAEVIEYQSTKVPVVEVRAAFKDFMGEYANPVYKRYDNSYNPDDPTEPKYFLKFGDMNRPSTSGSWDN
ncbi:MAG: hypothetical protein AAF502_22140 [Bacteroidota bacterium]